MRASLTIVVPVLNRADVVTRTLDGIAAGSLRPQRLVVVDNGSTDGSADVCRKWCADHGAADFQTMFVSETRRGAAIARNTGLVHVETDYVYFFDSDDDFDPVAVADICEAAGRENPDLMFIPVWQEAGGTRRVRAYKQDGRPQTHIINSMLSTVSMVFRTDWLRHIGGWDETLTTWDDWELGCRSLMNHPRMSWLTSRAYHTIHVHPDSLTGPDLSSTAEATARAMQQVAADIETTATLHEGAKRKCRRALFHRCSIMLGKLRQEASADGSAVAVYEQLSEELQPTVSKLTWALGKLLERATAHGLRGAWRIAM